MLRPHLVCAASAALFLSAALYYFAALCYSAAAIRSSIPPPPWHPPVGAASLIPARGSAIHSLQYLGRLILGNESIESEPDAKPARRDAEFIDSLVL